MLCLESRRSQILLLSAASPTWAQKKGLSVPLTLGPLLHTSSVKEVEVTRSRNTTEFRDRLFFVKGLGSDSSRISIKGSPEPAMRFEGGLELVSCLDTICATNTLVILVLLERQGTSGLLSLS